jgi:hypothetical protein
MPCGQCLSVGHPALQRDGYALWISVIKAFFWPTFLAYLSENLCTTLNDAGSTVQSTVLGLRVLGNAETTALAQRDAN